MPKDSCYHSVKARYAVFPSARASQAIAKCRKGKGQVRKTKEGLSLKDGRKRNGKILKQGNLVGPVVLMNIAAPLKRFQARHLKQSMN